MTISLESSSAALAGLNIVVDLTPMLPGGGNGGAKQMILALLSALAAQLPQTQFLLLTAESSHSELDGMEIQYPNIQRLCVLHASSAPPNPLPVAFTWREKIMDWMKAAARRALPFSVKQRIKQWLHRAQPAPGTANLLRQLQANMLFCPFTAPFYADKNIPTISVIYDLQYRAYPQFFTPEELYQREEAFKTACRKAEHLVTISEFVKKSVIEASGLTPQQVSSVTIGSFRSLRHPGDEVKTGPLLAGYGLAQGEFILYPANFWEHKNHAMLLTAFGMYCQAHPDQKLKLVCTGAPGNSADNFCDTVQRMGLTDRVVYPGFVTAEEYECLLNSAFALIFPSLYEGFGIPVLEAMAAGVPVLCSNITSLPEVGGDAVVYFDPRKPTEISDTIERLTNEPGLREKLIENGLQRAVIFDGPSRMANEYIDIFSNVIRSYTCDRKDSIQGIYPDGWTSPYVEIYVSSDPKANPRSLSIAFENPAWIKTKVNIHTFLGEKLLVHPTALKPGQKTHLQVPLPAAGGIIAVEISPTFSPYDLGMNNDNRQLGLLCSQCEIIQASGKVNLLEGEVIS